MFEAHNTFLARCDYCTQLLKSKHGFFYFQSFEAVKDYAVLNGWVIGRRGNIYCSTECCRRGEYEYYRNAIKTGVNIVKIKCEKCGKETELEFKGYKDKISGKFIVVDVESNGFIPIKGKWFCSDCKIKEMENLLANHKKLEIDLGLVIDYSLSRGFKQYEIKPEYGLPDLTVAKYLLELKKNKIK